MTSHQAFPRPDTLFDLVEEVGTDEDVRTSFRGDLKP